MLSEDELIEARQKLAVGRIIATREMPYFATALMAMSPHEREGLGTFAVDERWRMYYDPIRCLEWTVKEIAAVWLHETGHLIRSHSQRYQELEGLDHDPSLFNAAGDAAINSDLRDQGILLPNPDRRYYAEPNPSFPTWKKGMIAEEMYYIARGKNPSGDSNPQEQENQSSPDKSESEEPSEKDSIEQSDDNSNNQDEPPKKSKDDDKSDSDTKDSSESNPDDKENDSDTNDDSDSSPTADDNDEQKGEKGDSESEDKGTSDSDDEDSSKDGELESKAPEKSDSDNDNPTKSDEQGDPSDDESSGEPNKDGNSGSNGTPSGDESNDDGDESKEGKDKNPTSNPMEEGSDSADKEGSESDSKQSGDEGSDDSTNDDDGLTERPLPDCGSAVDGVERDYEEKNDDDGSVDKVAEEAIKQETAKNILDYDKSNPGKVPGDLVREAENILNPQIDWQDEFAALIRHLAATHAGYTDYSYARPSRRSAGSSFIMPSMRTPPAPEIAVIFDTSASMKEQTEIAMGLAEMEDILSRSARYSASQSIKIINCDAGASVVQVVRDLNDYVMVGGGGTDMRVGIKVASKLKPKLDIIVTITDGGTSWPRVIPPDNERATYIALIVGQEDNTKNRGRIPDWMTVIFVEVPDKRKGKFHSHM